MYERFFAIGSRELKVLCSSPTKLTFIQDQPSMSAITHFTMKTASDLYEYCNKILYNSQSNSVNLPLNIITELKHECS